MTPETTGKFGTPKCELICQLLRCEEPENGGGGGTGGGGAGGAGGGAGGAGAGAGGGGGGVWVSAHPSIGEKLVAALIHRGAFDHRLAAPVEAPPEVEDADALGAGDEGGGGGGDGVADGGADGGDDGAMGGSSPSLNLALVAVASPASASLALSPPAPKSPLAVQSQVTVRRKVGTSASGGYRPDFRVLHADGSSTLLETKQVVDTDYDPRTAALTAKLQAPHPVYAPGGAILDAADESHPAAAAAGAEAGSSCAAEAQEVAVHYDRAGIFPWGKRGQKGPDGESVVSARAIEHLRELMSIARTASSSSSLAASASPLEHAAVVLMAGRSDVSSIRPNGAACPSFAAYLEEAREAGVRVLGHKCRWGEGEDVGKVRLERSGSTRRTFVF